MSVKIRGKGDKWIRALKTVLEKYQAEHPRAECEAYRQNSVSLRIRIIDADFKGVPRAERHERVWQLLEELPEALQSQISVLLLLTPEEKKKSFASVEFDDPVPTGL